MDTLANNTIHPDLKVRKASILTIGYICEMLYDSNSEIDPKTCEQFLGSIILSSREEHDTDIVDFSMKALRNSLNFMKPILKNN